MKKILPVILLALFTAAHAQEPSEEVKKRALLRAYHLNGDSMVRWGSIDLSGEDLSRDPAVIRTIPILPSQMPPHEIGKKSVK
jgi:hypothetical protein